MKRASNHDKCTIAFIANNAGAGQLFKWPWWITLFSGEIGIGRSEFSSFGSGGGLSFLGLGFPNLVHAGGGVWERGVSEFAGSEVRSGTLL